MPSSAVRDCLFNLFAATLLIGGRSSIHNLRTRHAVVTGTHYMCALVGQIKDLKPQPLSILLYTELYFVLHLLNSAFMS